MSRGKRKTYAYLLEYFAFVIEICGVLYGLASSRRVDLQEGLRQNQPGLAMTAALIVHAKVLSNFQEMQPKSQLAESGCSELRRACLQGLAGQLKRSLDLLRASARNGSVEAHLTWSLRAAAAFVSFGKDAVVSRSILFSQMTEP